LREDHKINWGIIGLGNIANQFCHDLLLIDDANIEAVASRNQEKANAFGQKYGAFSCYNNYDAIFNDNKIDIVYIATPHNLHAALSIKAMEHGKHVLCEKPVALSRRETLKIMACSKRTNQFFMEAFWTRFNPSIVEAYRKVKAGVIGNVKYVNADFAFRVDIPKESRMTQIELGGGSLLDMGVYPIFLSYLMLGKPEKIMASSNFFETGADKQTSIILQYKNAQAILHSSFVSPSNMIATISGSDGRININPIWHEAQSYALIQNNQKVDFHHPTIGKGFTYEIEACYKAIKNNQIESEMWTHQNSLELITIVDEVRHETGLKFPS